MKTSLIWSCVLDNILEGRLKPYHSRFEQLRCAKSEGQADRWRLHEVANFARFGRALRDHPPLPPQTYKYMKAVPPSDAHLTQSQWVIALKERGHLPARCDRYEYYNVEISEEEYEKVLERATLG